MLLAVLFMMAIMIITAMVVAHNRLAERAVGPAAPELDGGTLVWMHFKATLLK